MPHFLEEPPNIENINVPWIIPINIEFNLVVVDLTITDCAEIIFWF